MYSRRLNELEKILDNMDESHPSYAALNAEADQLADEKSKVEEAFLACQKAKEAELKAKIERIRTLDKLGKTDQMIEEFGQEFINDYSVDGHTITSSVSEEQWTVDDVDSKLRLLLYYRIYDNYVRVRH